jgi:hypothetical protein
MEAMMLFQEAKDRPKDSQDHVKSTQDQEKTTNKVTLEAEKENDSSQKEFREVQRVMEPKRDRTHAVTTGTCGMDFVLESWK